MLYEACLGTQLPTLLSHYLDGHYLCQNLCICGKPCFKVRLHYNKNAAFLHQASWLDEPEIFFVRDKMANTNAKTPHFCRSVNEPLKDISLKDLSHNVFHASEFLLGALQQQQEVHNWFGPSVTRLGVLLDFGQLIKVFGNN